MHTPGPCYFVIFGATGNLASTQLLPALYRLESEGHLNATLRFIAFARREWGREGWLQHLERLLRDHVGGSYDRAVAERFAERFKYVRGDLSDAGSYQRILEAMSEPRSGTCENAVFYLAIPPGAFSDVVVNLDRAGINRRHGRHRIVVEKPFGENLESACRLNSLLHEHFDEPQIYRIDHFLGKETVQNLLVFRFANTLVEPVWNRNYIDHVQITVAEESGIGERAGYYDRAGASRDMLQNHLLQLMTVAAMEPPARLEADPLRDEKVKVLRSVRPVSEAEADDHFVRAQYAAGEVGGRRVPAYREETGVPAQSTTETFVAAKFRIDNWRWRNVPFYLRTGKRLPHKTSFVAIRFRHPPQLLFHEACGEHIDPNWMVLSIQPDEGMYVDIHAKRPGLEMATRVVRLNASYRAEKGAPMEAYQTLLLDVIEGDRSLFLRFDEVEWAWRVIDPLLRRSAEQREVKTYPAGSWGPAEANRVLERPDQAWRNRV